MCVSSDHRYVALKVYIRTPPSYSQMNGEIKAYQHSSKVRSSHPGQRFVRKVLDSFEISRADGTHHCPVHPPLHMSLWELQRIGRKTCGLPEDMVKGALRQLLLALDFLHTEANMTHCGTSSSNCYILQNR